MESVSNKHNTPQKVHPFFKLFLNIITVLIIYTNLAIWWNYSPIERKLPIPRFTHFIFDIYTVFATYQNFNVEYVILVQIPKTSEPGSYTWKKLDAKEYFPYKRGERIRRMSGYMHYYYYHKPDYLKHLRYLAFKISERYNKFHPNEKAKKTIIGYEVWPRSRESFYAQKKMRDTSFYSIMHYP